MWKAQSFLRGTISGAAALGHSQPELPSSAEMASQQLSVLEDLVKLLTVHLHYEVLSLEDAKNLAMQGYFGNTMLVT